MKMRIGFVSNSSSTSFIVYIPEKHTAQQLTAMAIESIKGKKKDLESMKKAVKPLLMMLFKKLKIGSVTDDELKNILDIKGGNDEEENEDEAREIFEDIFEKVLKPYIIESHVINTSENDIIVNIASARVQKKITAIKANFKK